MYKGSARSWSRLVCSLTSAFCAAFILSVALGNTALGQQVTLSLGSGNAAAGSAASVPLSLGAAGGAQPPSLQWTMTYGPSVTGITVGGGAKGVSCSSISAGSTTCVMFDNTTNPIGGGSIATASVSIAAGSTSASLPIAVSNVMASDAAGNAIAASGTAGTITMIQPQLIVPGSVSCSPSSVNAPGSAACTVTLTGAAPAGGLTVSLASGNSSAAVPASVTVAAGTSSANFTATVASIASNQSATITATANTVAVTYSLAMVSPAALSSVACSPTTLGSGQSASCTVTLTKAATSATVVALASSTALLTVPASVNVASGASTGTFTAAAGSIAAGQTAVITATSSGVTTSVALNLTAAVTVSGLTCTPANVSAAGTVACTATLSGAAPAGGLNISLSSNHASVTVPASVTAAAGAASASFSATVGTITANQTATLTAAGNGASRTFALTLTLPLQISSLGCIPAVLSAGQSAACTVTLNRAAQAALTVSLSSNASTLSVPASIGIASGGSSGVFTATAGAVSSAQTATVTAALLAPASTFAATASFGTTATVTLVPTATVTGLTCNPATVTGPGSATCSITLSTAAPAGGLSVHLTSGNPAATVPASVTVVVGLTGASFAVRVAYSASDQTAVITALIHQSSHSATLSLVAARWTISGTITPSTLGGGVTVVLSGAANAVVTTDSLGRFSFPGLLNGSYALTPNKSGLAFTPAQHFVSLNRANQSVTFAVAPGKKWKSTAISSTISDATPNSLTLLSSATGMAGKACSPGGLVTLSGTNLTAQDAQSGSTYPLPTTLAGLQVQINGEAAPLLLAGPSQINLQCPLLSAGATLDFTVISADGSQKASVQAAMTAAAPDLFTVNGSNQGVILIASKNEIAMPKTAGATGSPAQAGDLITIYATGLGEGNAPVANGSPALAAPLVALKNRVTVFVGEVAVDPQLSILAPGTVGLDQVSAVLPPEVTTGSAVPLYIQVTLADGTVVRSNTVTIAIDAPVNAGAAAKKPGI